jgi:hypothetical protein
MEVLKIKRGTGSKVAPIAVRWQVSGANDSDRGMFSHLSVYSVSSVVNVFSQVKQSFQTRVRRGHREEIPSMEHDYALLPVLTG